jgi:hypothetical protein
MKSLKYKSLVFLNNTTEVQLILEKVFKNLVAFF